MRLFCCSFASKKFSFAQERQYTFFIKAGFSPRQIILFNPSNLDQEFLINHPKASELNKFAGYSFKPYFLQSILKNLKDDDLLLYLDTNDIPLPGIKEYITKFFKNNIRTDILFNSTNYPNFFYMSNFHKNNLSLELLFSSLIKPQPEAGALIVKNSYRSRSILRIWYEMTAINFEELSETEISRHDQETLFLLSNIYKSLQYESWLRYKIFKYGLRKYIKFEYLRR